MDKFYTEDTFCDECSDMVSVMWLLSTCDKNPQGLKSQLPHGVIQKDGNVMCDPDFCDPIKTEIDLDFITKEYVETHNVHKECSDCGNHI